MLNSNEAKVQSSEADNNTQQDHETPSEIDLEDKWLIRDCDLYYEEYKECTDFRGRFHQYFIFGETLDCNQWRKDYDNCCKWKDNKDLKAAESLINSEKERRMQRLQAHYRNDTWKRRTSPPENWEKPLPEWMVKRDADTYLSVKAQELREGTVSEKDSFCCVM